MGGITRNQYYYSVIIPVYNVEDYLGQCVDSVLAQDFHDYEIILIDDGSTDSSGAICDQYAKQHEFIRVIRKTNGGASSARNLGTEIAGGEYILYLDSDDFLSDQQGLGKLREAALDGHYDVVFFKSMKYYQDGKTVDYYGDYNEEVFTEGKTEIFRYMLREHKQLACAWNRIVRKSILSNGNIRFQENTIGEDIPWTVQLFEAADRIGCINSSIHMYRQGRAGSITNTRDSGKLNDLFRIIQNLLKAYENDSTEFGKAVLSFAAFEYAILLRNISKSGQAFDTDELLELNGLLEYALDRKTKAVRRLNRMLGIRGTIKVLRWT